jgi:hypothetical protein
VQADGAPCRRRPLPRTTLKFCRSDRLSKHVFNSMSRRAQFDPEGRPPLTDANAQVVTPAQRSAGWRCGGMAGDARGSGACKWRLKTAAASSLTKVALASEPACPFYVAPKG